MFFSPQTLMLSEHLHFTFPTADVIVSDLMRFIYYILSYSRANTKKRETGVCAPAPLNLSTLYEMSHSRQEKASVVLKPKQVVTKFTTNIRQTVGIAHQLTKTPRLTGFKLLVLALLPYFQQLCGPGSQQAHEARPEGRLISQGPCTQGSGSSDFPGRGI